VSSQDSLQDYVANMNNNNNNSLASYKYNISSRSSSIRSNNQRTSFPMMIPGQVQGQQQGLGSNRTIDIEAPPSSARASQSSPFTSLSSVESDHTQKGSRDKSYVPFIMTRAADLEAAHAISIDEELEYGNHQQRQQQEPETSSS
jgi:hypothetical protein